MNVVDGKVAIIPEGGFAIGKPAAVRYAGSGVKVSASDIEEKRQISCGLNGTAATMKFL